jgi:tripartite-type tricarboxylate transporter receptor subunit TctC
MGSTPAEFKSFLATQIDKWSALVKRFGIRSE